MNILYQADNCYALGLGVSITSLFENNQNVKDIIVYIIDGGISEDNKKKINKTATKYNRTIEYINAIGFDEILKENGALKYRNSYATFYKLFAHERIEKSIKKILYIDCDTIVNSIEDLFDIDLGDKPIAMSEDLFLYDYKKKYNFNKMEPMYSAGVILFNYEYFRIKGYDKELMEYINNSELSLLLKHEQDLLNIVFKDRIYRLPQKYNCYSLITQFGTELLAKVYKNRLINISDIKAAELDPRIIHFLQFCGKQPWHSNNINGCNNLFHLYKNMSEWKDEPDIYKKESIFIKIEKILYRVLPKSSFLWFFLIAHEITKEI